MRLVACTHLNPLPPFLLRLLYYEHATVALHSERRQFGPVSVLACQVMPFSFYLGMRLEIEEDDPGIWFAAALREPLRMSVKVWFTRLLADSGMRKYWSTEVL